MKSKTFSFLLFLFTLLATAYFISCGNDTTTSPPPGGGTGYKPTIRLLQSNSFVYTNDSITAQSPYDTIRTPLLTVDTIDLVGTFNQQGTAARIMDWGIISFQQVSKDTIFLRYDSSGGKFYQWGIVKFINPNVSSATWDLVADFSATRGNQWHVGDVNYSVTLPVVGNVTFTGPLMAKVADSTSIMTTGNPPKSVSCYRIEMTATISGALSGGGTISATIKVDYYIGYYLPGNPSGIVEVKLNPFSFVTNPGPVYIPQPGYIRKLQDFSVHY